MQLVSPVMVLIDTVFMILSWQLPHCDFATAATFTQWTLSPFEGLITQLYAGSPIACAGQCTWRDDCGAYHWDEHEMPHCSIYTRVWGPSLVVTGTYYIMTILSNGEGLLHTPTITSDDTFYPQAEKCAAMGHELIHMPATPRDVVIGAAYGGITFNVRRDGLTGAMVTYSGDPVDTSLMRLPITIKEAGQETLPDQCFGASHFNFWVISCPDWGAKSISTICQYK